MSAKDIRVFIEGFEMEGIAPPLLEIETHMSETVPRRVEATITGPPVAFYVPPPTSDEEMTILREGIDRAVANPNVPQVVEGFGTITMTSAADRNTMAGEVYDVVFTRRSK